MSEYATVDPISKDIAWSAKAALGDALSRGPDGARLFVVWLDENDKLCFSKACQNETAVYMMSAAIHKVMFPDA